MLIVKESMNGDSYHQKPIVKYEIVT